MLSAEKTSANQTFPPGCRVNGSVGSPRTVKGISTDKGGIDPPLGREEVIE